MVSRRQSKDFAAPRKSAIRRVFDAYALFLLAAVAFPPWRGIPLLGQHADGGPVYAWIWAPPRVTGWYFAPDLPRLLLEVLSLTLVMALAVVFLRSGSRGTKSHQGSSRPL